MFRDQAHQFLLGFLLFCMICNTSVNSNNIDSLDADKKQNSVYVNFIEVLDSDPSKILWGQNVTVACKTNLTTSYHWWMFDSKNITDNSSYIVKLPHEPVEEKSFYGSYLLITNATSHHAGNYSCHIHTKIDNNDVSYVGSVVINVTMPPHVLSKNHTVREKANYNASLFCMIEGLPIQEVYWLKDNQISSKKSLIPFTETVDINNMMKNTMLHLTDLSKKDSGNYSCIAKGSDAIKESDEVNEENTILLLVMNVPQVHIDFVKALGNDTVYLNWTFNDGNDPEHIKFRIQYLEMGTGQWVYHRNNVIGPVTHVVLEGNFKNNTHYTLRMEASNSQGDSQKSNEVNIKTLNYNPVFVPEVKVTGVTFSSVTISWTPLPDEFQGHVHYFQLRLWSTTNSTLKEAMHSSLSVHIYFFVDLMSATTYQFQVAACSEYTKKCGPWSNTVNGTTLDGISEPPENVSILCHFDNISRVSLVKITWKPPKTSNGIIKHYDVALKGDAYYRNEKGIIDHVTWGPKVTSVNVNSFQAHFYNISANTNYTVKISAVTRTKKHGKQVSEECMMPATTPDKNGLSRFSWVRLEEQGKWMFKLFMPRMSERNGAICCYRVFMVRMESHKSLAEMPSPEDLRIGTYHQAHRTPVGGAYVAEMISNEHFHSEVFLGDDNVLNYTNSPCLQCYALRASNSYKKKVSVDVSTLPTTLLNSGLSMTSTMLPTINVEDSVTATTTTTTSTVEYPSEPTMNRVKRNVDNDDDLDEGDDENFVPPIDGALDIGSNYTGFVEIIVYGSRKGEMLAAYSNYFSMLNPGPQVIEVAAPATDIMSIVIKILCALIVVVLILLMALYLLHRHLCRSLRGRHRLVSISPPDMSPIPKSDLTGIYMERHKDSDYGFQREFELLPDRFADRTTRFSDARENIYKNRYPDIKAYDQTRVKLAQIDSIAGSDYINANFVIGYKERKKFICAQGPMDNTVCDYWRMIWEQHLELILMLTNLEEYSKTKCAKYWPDKTDGEKNFGDISVVHIDETKYSDYIVRRLHIYKDKDRDRENEREREREERLITQYHFLVWKDFMAPEHPHGIIKFIKRMNEAYSLEKGSILVHCSAGVGRTGTLVALDSLLQQLNEEGQVAIFNTICDMRHQRNFLVQSLKQYIFIYRALMEVAQYGDTEIIASQLKLTVDKLRQQNMHNDQIKCKMEEEFENIKNAVEDRKSNTVGSGEENNQKNRSESIIPYDRNRVILTPIPGREHSTYINASFIEGYDNSESFIITQDPLDITIADFWRMISEQGICVIVMLSELGANNTKKCPRYWPDDEINYDHIGVKYIQSESCPYYTRRELIVSNNKCDENIMVTQFQYHGWPTVEGEVPEVTRGLIELVDQAQAVQDQHGPTGPIVVHCSYGSDRSSMFVGLSILAQQLRVEKRVDIFTTTRKLRSQRQGMISTYAQYEFLHRAIVNYADLNQLNDSS